MDLGIAGRTALIVGGSGLIGRAVAAALIRERVRVVLAARTADRLTEAAGALGAKVGTLTLDTRDANSVTPAIEELIAAEGAIDIVVNAAAPPASTLDPAKDQDPGQVLDAFDAKAVGYLRVIDAVLPYMRRTGFGRIINISGQNAFLTRSVTGAVRNAAVIVASKALADSVAGTGITINVVNPGPVTATPTPAPGPAGPGDSTPEQVAALVTFLASAQAAAISGESIAVGHRVHGVQ
ncbi:SDR family NAD(P)-dependent oxidoreductase [Actinoplanes aureus]|jgi:NAD(P)-dependent dehydrogenase (short-subunit alcohol dehydrogenase family)|uniref:SDR family NAD(P)-dependent oxidoreductase n=1 Tax=Actinoplanes aureus TaxID=2792083 RepID=A0A931CBM5_9ACTN|nr:SDR family NAD(P)-dependent oxidoreductase [Actinoplanes aureus]MBG0564381.1 SDR family NAD(P)-dependent oxidoreductase [Actinoplanes aureus]